MPLGSARGRWRLAADRADHEKTVGSRARNSRPRGGKGSGGYEFGVGRQSGRSVGALDLRGVRILSRRQRKPLRQTKDYGRDCRRWLRRVREGAREPRVENSGRAFLRRGCATLLRRGHGVPSLAAGQDRGRTALGNFWNWWARTFGGANWSRFRSGGDRH